MANYQKLFEPIQIKNVLIKNRIAKSSQWLIYPEEDGSIGPRIKEFYAEQARGGVGLIIVEESICEYPLGASNEPHIRIDDDKFIAGLSELAGAIHDYDCAAFIQITHAGPCHAPLRGGPEDQPIAPSSIDPPSEPQMAIAREMTKEELKKRIEMYAQAVLRAKKAGFDGAEIHLAHYALGNSFLSRRQNKRNDEYGADTLENRARFGVEILQRARELCGHEFVLGVRMSSCEYGDPLGTTNEEACQFAKMFEAAGADYIQASIYGYGEYYMCWAPDYMRYPEPHPSVKFMVDRMNRGVGGVLDEEAKIKQSVNIPVSVVGRMDPDVGEKALRDGKADMIWMGRRLLCDPELPNKVKEGRSEDVRPCLGCGHCLDCLFKNIPIQCRMNPFLGNEWEMRITPAQQVKKVIIVGGGPGGLEAARVASLRGHEVAIYDHAKQLGGLLPMAAFIKGTDNEDIPAAISWWERQLKKQGVKIHLGQEVTPALIEKEKPDVVVLSPGGRPVNPSIPGIDNKIVVTTKNLEEKASEFVRLAGSNRLNFLTKVFLPVGNKVVVVGGIDLAGIEAAEFLAKRGRKVTLVDESEAVMAAIPIPLQMRLAPWMETKNIRIYPGIKYKEITSKGMVITSKEGEEELLEADTVMIITDFLRNTALYERIKEIVPQVFLIGDAKADENGWIVGATHDGARAALEM